MARKRKTRTITRYVKKAKRVGRKISNKPETVILPAMVYGAVRQKASQAIAPLTSKIPLGQFADEAGMGILSYLIAKKGKGMFKKVGIAGLTIEAALVGQTIASQGFSLTGTTANSSGSSFR